jgi:hypothetical protein
MPGEYMIDKNQMLDASPLRAATRGWKSKVRLLSTCVVILLLLFHILPVPAISGTANAMNGMPQATSTLTFITQADARVEERNPASNFGTANYLQVTGSNNNHMESYVRFAVSGISGTVQSAKLRVYSTTNATQNGPAVYAAGSSWTETGITWNNRSARTSGALDNKDAIAKSTWTDYTVTALVSGNGTYTFVLVGDSTDNVVLSSREGSHSPQLVITVNTSTPTPTSSVNNTPTQTPTSGPTLTSGGSDLIFANDFETGNLAAWTGSVTDAGDLSVTSAAALVGTKGMQAVIDDANLIYVTDDSPNSEPRYRARFYFDPNSIAMASGDNHRIIVAYAGTSTAVIRCEFRYYSGAYQVEFLVLNDSGSWQSTNWFTISDAKHSIEFDWKAATAVGASNGYLTLWIDGTQQANLTGIDNDTRRVDRVRLGAIYGIDTGTRGTYYFDDFVSRRQNYIGPASGGGTSSTPVPTATTGPTPTPTATGSSSSVILVGAGDIASCSNNNDEATAKLLDGISGTVFTTGDNTYSSGTSTEYTNCYDPTWGRHKSRTKPVPGNHDYSTSGASGYFNYFNNIPSYYAYNLGGWRIYALNSEISVSSTSAQVQWLQSDLAANPARCVLAYWHKPRWSSGTTHGSNSGMQTLWQTLYNAGAEIVLNGHEHNYERFAEMNASGAAVSSGLREFVVGMGGESHYGFGTPLSTSQVRNGTTFGVLKLTLTSTGYNWQFVPVAGSSFTDSGSGTCH